jgi:hypothetical protein
MGRIGSGHLTGGAGGFSGHTALGGSGAIRTTGGVVATTAGLTQVLTKLTQGSPRHILNLDDEDEIAVP